MTTPLPLDLPPATRRILELMAEVGIIGATAEEVAAYLITREIDDMLRSGCIGFGDKPVSLGEG